LIELGQRIPNYPPPAQAHQDYGPRFRRQAINAVFDDFTLPGLPRPCGRVRLGGIIPSSPRASPRTSGSISQ
jgi:hypothetical protein